MTMFAELDDATVDALLSGETTGDVTLAPVEDVVRALRSRVGAEVAPTMTDALQAQLRSPFVVPLDARRRTNRARRGGVAAAAAVAILAMGGTAAAQNRLPAQLQDIVSSTADVFGVDVPGTEERGNSGDTPDPEGYSGTTTPGGATPAEPHGGGEPATPATPPDHADDQGPPSTLPEQADDDAGPPDDPGSPPVTTGGPPDDPGPPG